MVLRCGRGHPFCSAGSVFGVVEAEPAVDGEERSAGIARTTFHFSYPPIPVSETCQPMTEDPFWRRKGRHINEETGKATSILRTSPWGRPAPTKA